MAHLGAHVPTAGGVRHAFANAAAIGGEALQLFVKNPNRWDAKALGDAERAAYHRARVAHGCPPVTAHASYLINLAATDPETLRRSRDALADELARCDALAIPGLVLHPGAHLGAGVETGLDAAARSLDLVLSGAEACGQTTQVWLENTAGQGTVLGSRLEDLAAIVARSDHRAHLGICLDTCHAFAAGYEVHTADGLAAFLDEVEAQLGFHRLGCFHLNDSRFALGSRRDRHANLGAGEIGLATFVALASDPRFAALPMLLETPRGEDEQDHARDLARLRAALREA